MLAVHKAADANEAKTLMLGLADALRLSMRQQPTTADLVSRKLLKVEELLGYVTANGNPKFALDKLMLEFA
jgi:hypothetical protein